MWLAGVLPEFLYQWVLVQLAAVMLLGCVSLLSSSLDLTEPVI